MGRHALVGYLSAIQPTEHRREGRELILLYNVTFRKEELDTIIAALKEEK